MPSTIAHESVHSRQRATAYVSSAAATASITPGTPVNLLANATLTGKNVGSYWEIDVATNGMKYVGANSHAVYLSVALSVTSSASNQVLTFEVRKNGVLETGSKIKRKVGTGSDVGALALIWETTLAQNDIITIWVDSDSSTTVTAENLIGMVF